MSRSSGQPIVVGLTGGIAAGKSVVARMFGELGAALVDADTIAREVVTPGSAVLEQVARELGREVIDGRGALDRARLGAIVFADPDARKRLERIMHPAILAASLARFAELARAGHPLILYEAALLVETGRYRDFARLIVVVADDALRIERLMARDGIGRQQARQRLSAQAPQASKAALADYVVDNSSDLEQTRTQVQAIWRELQALTGD